MEQAVAGSFGLELQMSTYIDFRPVRMTRDLQMTSYAQIRKYDRIVTYGQCNSVQMTTCIRNVQCQRPLTPNGIKGLSLSLLLTFK